ncbi:MAG: type II toxin-antitoxin system VapC family toxin [Pseudonocardiaceae bacterium]
MILVDANIPMYLVGADHPNKLAARGALEGAVNRGQRLVTDVEVLQEIMRRFVAIDRRAAIQPAFDVLRAVVDETLLIDAEDVEVAKRIVLDGYRLSARDAMHLAVMRRHDIDTIMSLDRGFDRYPGVTRIG